MEEAGDDAALGYPVGLGWLGRQHDRQAREASKRGQGSNRASR
jgi:hypothetical protein